MNFSCSRTLPFIAFRRKYVATEKQKTIQFLQSFNINVPLHGLVRDVVSKIRSEIPIMEFSKNEESMRQTWEDLSSVVVYENDSPVLMLAEDAIKHFPNNFCTRFEPSSHVDNIILTTVFRDYDGYSILRPSSLFPHSNFSMVTHRFRMERPSRIPFNFFSIDWSGPEFEYAVGFKVNPVIKEMEGM